MLIEVYDVGGTWVRAALADRKDNVIFYEKIKEPTEKDFCSQIRKLSSQLRKKGTPDCVSVIVPGPVDKGILLKAPPMNLNEPIDLNFNLGTLHEHVYFGNDLNAAVQAELVEGYGKQYKNFYVLTLSTGIGSGIVLDGIPLMNKSGEFGHSVLERQYAKIFRCGCGNNGCWSSLCSGNGIENLIDFYLEENLSCEEFFEFAKQKPFRAQWILDTVRDYNAQGIGNMINALDMEAIIVMGSLGLSQFDSIIPNKEEISKYTVNSIPEILKTRLGDDIGLLGAYYYGWVHATGIYSLIM